MVNNTEKEGKMTQVKTIYARACVLLLALNFCLTTYAVLRLHDTVQDQVADTYLRTTGPASESVKTASGTPTAEATAPTLEATTTREVPPVESRE